MKLELTIVAVAVVAVVAPSPAWACGPWPTPYWTFSESLPADGARNVPRDPGIVLVARPWVNIPDGIAFVPATARLLDVATGTQVAIHPVPWVGGRTTSAWQPDAPLAPKTAYRVEAAMVDQGLLPPEVIGPTQLSFSFTTGQDLAPPLELAGDVGIALERYDRTEGGCGNCGCTPTSTFQAMRARLTIPPVRGGTAADGYRSYVTVRADVPATFVRPGEPTDGAGASVDSAIAAIVPGEETLVYVTTPMLMRPYRPCVSFAVWDPGGHLLIPTPVCLDAINPLDFIAGQTPAAERASCAAVPGSHPWILAWALLGLRGARRRGASRHDDRAVSCRSLAQSPRGNKDLSKPSITIS